MSFRHGLSALALGVLMCFPASGQEAQGKVDPPADGSAPSPGQDASATVGPLRLRATLSHGLYNRFSPRRLVLKVDFAATSSAALKRPALNVALVVDRSGSMSEDKKFDYAMDAARLVVENLSARDIVSLIAFNQDAVVLSPAGRAVNKAFLGHRLHEIGPVGWTNLSAGLLEAFAQIDAKAAKGQTKRVIVLTDGLANRGITDPVQLRELVAAAHKRKIGVSTLGVGTEFDGTLLTALAEAGGGRYTYIRSPEQIPVAVASELNGLLAVVAQNVRLEVRPRGKTRIARVYGRMLSGPAASFRLGDVRAGERGVFLLDLAPQAFTEGAVAGVDVLLLLDQPEIGARERKTVHVEATFTADSDRVRKSEHATVQHYATILDAVEKAEDAVLGLDLGRFREVTRAFGESYEAARRHARETRDQELLNETFLLKHFMAELDAASRSGLMHDHDEAMSRLRKEIEYRRYLQTHHRSRD